MYLYLYIDVKIGELYIPAFKCMIQTLPRYTDTYQQNLQFNEQFLLWHVYSIMLAPAQRQPVIEDINIFAVQDVKYFSGILYPNLNPDTFVLFLLCAVGSYDLIVSVILWCHISRS